MNKRIQIHFLLLAVAMAMIPSMAFANVGIGYFMLALPIVLVALIPAIPLEALVLKAILQVPMRKAFSLSLWANIRSTIYGLILGIVFDFILIAGTGGFGPEPTKSSVTTMLIPFLLFSWWIEHRAVKRLAKEFSGHRIAFATGVANILTYAAMFAFVWSTTLIPLQGRTYTKIQVGEAIGATSGLRVTVEEFWQQNNRFPANAGEIEIAIPEHKYFRINLEPESHISIQFLMPKEPTIDGKHLTFIPMLNSPDDGELRWECRAPDIPQYLLRLSDCQPKKR